MSRLVHETDRKCVTAAINVVNNRIAKGGKAHQSRDLTQAWDSYKAALKKLQCVDQPRSIYTEEKTTLELEILPKLLSVCLELSDYRGAHKFADMIIDLQYFTDSSDPQFTPRFRGALFIAYHSKASVFKQQGRFSAAIRNFVKASSYNVDCHALDKELEVLKQMETLQGWKRFAEEEQLRQQRAPKRRREEKRSRQKAAKETRKRQKRARGPGYVLGVKSL